MIRGYFQFLTPGLTSPPTGSHQQTGRNLRIILKAVRTVFLLAMYRHTFLRTEGAQKCCLKFKQLQKKKVSITALLYRRCCRHIEPTGRTRCAGRLEPCMAAGATKTDRHRMGVSATSHESISHDKVARGTCGFTGASYKQPQAFCLQAANSDKENLNFKPPLERSGF